MRFDSILPLFAYTSVVPTFTPVNVPSDAIVAISEFVVCQVTLPSTPSGSTCAVYFAVLPFSTSIGPSIATSSGTFSFTVTVILFE